MAVCDVCNNAVKEVGDERRPHLVDLTMVIPSKATLAICHHVDEAKRLTISSFAYAHQRLVVLYDRFLVCLIP